MEELYLPVRFILFLLLSTLFIEIVECRKVNTNLYIILESSAMLLLDVGNNVDIGTYSIYLISCLLFYYGTTTYLCEMISGIKSAILVFMVIVIITFSMIITYYYTYIYNFIIVSFLCVMFLILMVPIMIKYIECILCKKLAYSFWGISIAYFFMMFSLNAVIYGPELCCNINSQKDVLAAVFNGYIQCVLVAGALGAVFYFKGLLNK